MDAMRQLLYKSDPRQAAESAEDRAKRGKRQKDFENLWKEFTRHSGA